MKITEKERMKAEKVLNRYHIARKDIESFSFMKRYRQTDGKRDRMVYGPGIAPASWCSTSPAARTGC